MEIEEYLQECMSVHQDSLNAPAARESIDELKRYFDNLPKELVKLLIAFNGEKPGIEPINGVAYFMNVTTIIEHVEMMNDLEGEECVDEEDHPVELQRVIYDKCWIPFMFFENDVYFFDMNPTPDGADGQVFSMNVGEGCDCVEIQASSLIELIIKTKHGV